MSDRPFTSRLAPTLAIAALVALAVALGVWRLRRVAPETAPPEGAHGQSARDPAPVDAAADAASALPKPKRPDDDQPKTLGAQRERTYGRMRDELGLDAATMEKVRAIVDKNKVISEGNPEVSTHPMRRGECWEARDRAGLHEAEALVKLEVNQKLCGARHMVPVFGKDRSQRAELCIDQYEFPNMPCEYPMVYPSAQEAAQLCVAVGKRLCDAHEWEGACAGELRRAEDEYLWTRPRRVEMEFFKNEKREKIWAYGPEKNHRMCATGSTKSPKCNGGGWETCGTNSYPAGAFPECVSPFGVFDQHGNAAEHMNLPMKAEELGKRGGLGETEMKGSWFIFARGEAHEDDCRWRAPAWHATRIDYWNSHRNYHLGFRCCRDL